MSSSNWPQPQKPIIRVQQLFRALLISFILLGLTLIFWSFVRANNILAREDNPRLVEAELRIQRGQIFDREGDLLAVTVGRENDLTRQYPVAAVGPLVGYYSFRHGTAGIEEGLNELLRGTTADPWQNWWRTARHQPSVGRDVRLTLAVEQQIVAESLLGNQTGALILLELSGTQADVRAMVSHPTYDPNQLDAQFDELTNDETAPLLNRATQGQYQPGLMIAPFVLADSLANNAIALAQQVTNPQRPVWLNGTAVLCQTIPPEPATWADVLAHGCPGPLATLGQQLGNEALLQRLTQFQLTAPPTPLLNTETPDPEPLQDAALAAIGQDNLLVTPLQMSLAWATLARNGRFPHLRLVQETTDENDRWQPYPVPASAEQPLVLAPDTITRLRNGLPRSDNRIEFATLTPSGPEGAQTGWYVGLYPADTPQYLVLVVVEASEGIAEVVMIGQKMLTAVVEFP